MDPATTDISAPVADQTNTLETPTDQTPVVDAAVDSSGGEGGAVEQSSISEELASRAQWLGLDPADFGNDPTRLEWAISRYDRQLADFGRSLREPRQEQTNVSGTTTSQSPSFDLDKALPELSGEFDPAIVAWTKSAREAVKGMSAHYEQQVASLRKQYQDDLTPLKQEVEQRKVEMVREQVDGFFNGLGKEWDGMYGKGDFDSLSVRNPRAVQARHEVFMQANALGDAYKAMGQRVPAMKDLLRRALAAQHSDQQHTFARQQIIAQAKGSKSQAAASQVGKRTSPPTGREMAVQAAEQALRALRAK